jgi:transcription termination factor Rho
MTTTTQETSSAEQRVRPADAPDAITVRGIAEKRLFPAIDPVPSSTRRDDLLMEPAEHAAVTHLRRALAALGPQHALELLLDKTREPNEHFLRQVHAAR